MFSVHLFYGYIHIESYYNMCSWSVKFFQLCLTCCALTNGEKVIKLCSNLLKKSSLDQADLTHEYENFLGLMFQNSSRINDRTFPARSQFTEDPDDNYASADVLASLDFLEQTLPYLSRQYDERDLILDINNGGQQNVRGALCQKKVANDLQSLLFLFYLKLGQGTFKKKQQ